MWMLLLRPTSLLAIALGLALLGMGFFYKLHTHDLQQIGALKAVAEDARADARACSEGVKHLQAAQAKRDKEVAALLKEAEAKAREAEKQADATLQTRPHHAEDLCASALELDKQKLKERHP